jgi:hypothetical protein
MVTRTLVLSWEPTQIYACQYVLIAQFRFITAFFFIIYVLCCLEIAPDDPDQYAEFTAVSTAFSRHTLLNYWWASRSHNTHRKGSRTSRVHSNCFLTSKVMWCPVHRLAGSLYRPILNCSQHSRHNPFVSRLSVPWISVMGSPLELCCSAIRRNTKKLPGVENMRTQGAFILPARRREGWACSRRERQPTMSRTAAGRRGVWYRLLRILI